MQKITFEDYPSTNTPINATNLNTIQTNTENAISSSEGTLTNLINSVVESGSNTNGNYVKYADGTMICYRTISGTTNITTSWGNGYTSGNTNDISLGTFAEEFYSTPIVTATIVRGNYNCWLSTITGTTTTIAGYTALLRFTTASSSTYTLNVIAVGRWKA